MVKGVMPIHAAPSKVSMTRGSGISGRRDSTGRDQCRKRSVPQCWYMIGQPDGRARTARRSASSIISSSIVFDSLFISVLVQASIICADFLGRPEYFADVVSTILPLPTRCRLSLVQPAAHFGPFLPFRYLIVVCKELEYRKVP